MPLQPHDEQVDDDCETDEFEHNGFSTVGVDIDHIGWRLL